MEMTLIPKKKVWVNGSLLDVFVFGNAMDSKE